MNVNLFKKYDITGLKFNRLTTIKYVGKLDGRRYYYEFICDCGNIVIQKGTVVKNGLTKSCGCLQKEETSKNRINSARPVQERLFERINKTSYCWEYTGHKDKNGYGIIGIRNKSEKAHRISYTIFKGKIPPKMFVCHSCDNPSCINPDHLFLGTPNDNVQDMILKGRRKDGGKPHPGEKNGRALVTEKQVIEIRSLAGVISQIEISKRYGLCCSAIQRIINGKAWKHINEGSSKGKRVNIKIVKELDNAGNVIREFSSCAEAGKYHGMCPSSLWRACKKNRLFKGIRFLRE